MKIRDAFAKVVHDFGVAAMAERMGCNPRTLQNKANPRSESHCPTIDDIEMVTLYSGNPLIADSLCERAGGIFVKIFGFEGVSDVALLETVTAMGADFGKVCSALNESLADGNITPDEFDRVRTAVRELNRASLELVNRVEQLVVKPSRLKAVAQ